jgi:multicomponent K+:H+ antiporter subunit D
VSGLLTTIAMSRVGVRYFWATGPPAAAPAHHRDAAHRALLLLVGVLVWQADAVLRYANATARGLHDPQGVHRQRALGQALPSPTPRVKEACAMMKRLLPWPLLSLSLIW